MFPGGNRGRASGSILHSWYPRRPLQDITSVVRAIERRRARVGEDEGQSRGSHFHPQFLKVTKILLDITNENKEESEFLMPQKKLLNSIDTVEKMVMEELNKLK
ncbi:hypothetical protein Leryth_017810 [Lithospermum erythrorhizon]|uniref:Uncharacterized protein n=1 Tax=Lithospermum erythrorhizon TaxID=34254 RepID=A0AAV3NIL6_LITER|nr:hypothetical protein Leryth_017810 [Lithospermum erythrorhizon]